MFIKLARIMIVELYLQRGEAIMIKNDVWRRSLQSPEAHDQSAFVAASYQLGHLATHIRSYIQMNEVLVFPNKTQYRRQ